MMGFPPLWVVEGSEEGGPLVPSYLPWLECAPCVLF